MENINWLLIGITTVMTGFIIFMRVSEYLAHQKVLNELKAKGAELTVLIEDKKTVWMYSGMTVLVLVASWMVTGDIIERLSMSVVFSLLIGSEVLNAHVQSRLYANAREFVYGQVHERFRSIKGYEAKGKRMTTVKLLNKETVVLPNEFANSLKTHVQSIKDTKK